MATNSGARRRASMRAMARAMQRINEAGSDRARLLCELIVQEIQLSPATPYDPRTSSNTTGPHLRDSYRVREAPDGSGDFEIVTNRRYWRFVEFGTKEHGDAQPHLRPAIETVRAMFT